MACSGVHEVPQQEGQANLAVVSEENAIVKAVNLDQEVPENFSGRKVLNSPAIVTNFRHELHEVPGSSSKNVLNEQPVAVKPTRAKRVPKTKRKEPEQAPQQINASTVEDCDSGNIESDSHSQDVVTNFVRAHSSPRSEDNYLTKNIDFVSYNPNRHITCGFGSISDQMKNLSLKDGVRKFD